MPFNFRQQIERKLTFSCSFNLPCFSSLHFAFSTNTKKYIPKPTPQKIYKNTHTHTKKVSRCLKADFTPSMPFSVSGSFFANLGDQQTMEYMQPKSPNNGLLIRCFLDHWNYKNQNLCRSLELEFRSTWPYLCDSSTNRHHIVKGQVLFFLTELGHVDLWSQVWYMSCMYMFYMLL